MAGILPGNATVSWYSHSAILTPRSVAPRTRFFCCWAGISISRAAPGGFQARHIRISRSEVQLLRDIGESRLRGGGLWCQSASGSYEQDRDSKTPNGEGSEDNNLPRKPKTTSSDANSGINETSGTGSSSSPEKKRRGGWWRNRKWDWKETLGSQVREIGTMCLQLGVVLFLMRVLRPGFPLPGSDSRVLTSHVSVPFSEFLSRISNNQVQKVEVDGVHFTFRLKPEVDIQPENVAVLDRTAKRVLYSTTRPTDIKTPYEKMLENQVEFGAADKRSGGFLNSALVALLYIALFAGILRLPLKISQLRSRKARGSGSSKTGENGDAVTFADVAGVDEAKEELEEIVEFLRNPDRYTRLGARPPRGVLLVGLPGTGKTLLAKAVACEAEVPFISCSASEFVELYVGMGASRVRDLFARAKKDAPAIIFIDEIDAVAKSRDGRVRIASNDEREQTLNQLLTEMDGFDSNSAVIVLGATNRADVLDPALRRPGRFDRIVTVYAFFIMSHVNKNGHIQTLGEIFFVFKVLFRVLISYFLAWQVEPPDRHGREAILKVHISRKQLPLAADVDLNTVATATTGFTGADLGNLVNEAALLAGRANKLVVGKEDFIQAVERSVAGIEKKRSTLQQNEKAVVARHEAGHAVVGTAVANLLPGQPRVEKLSILPRSGGALGFTYIPPGSEDRYLLFVDELRGRLVTLLGGRAAEEVVFAGRVSTGALDDIKRATDMAYKAIAEYGLNQSIGPISLATLSSGGLDESGGAVPWAKDQGHMVDLVQKEVKSLLQSALAMALIVIRANPTVLEGLGAHLEANEKVDGEALQDWLKLVVAPVELATFIKGSYMLPEKAGLTNPEKSNAMILEKAEYIMPGET